MIRNPKPRDSPLRGFLTMRASLTGPYFSNFFSKSYHGQAVKLNTQLSMHDRSTVPLNGSKDVPHPLIDDEV